MDAEYLSAREAANILGVSARTVRRWIQSGKLPAARFGRSYRILATDLSPKGTERTQEGQGGQTAIAVGQSDLVALIDRLTQENVRLAGRVGFLEGQMRLLEAPRPPPWWRRLLRR